QLSARWPAAAAPVFSGLDAEIEHGEWLVITGPSGSGKSTLLAVLLGHLRPWAGRYLVNDLNTMTVDPRLLRQRIAWCPQEGHLFNSTLRANLLLARGREDAPSSREMMQVLHRVGLSELLGRLPLGLDSPIGAAGGQLSGGERQRVAVARTLLSRADVILVDEPTAHLDQDSAQRLMTDLRLALQDRLAVLVTHHPVAPAAGDRLLVLGSRLEVGAGSSN
ncbi:MAG: ATP-binding cassette domain-containing protein, partial [Microbacteriaceae bacterium]